jgi:hypothetical protein
MGVFSFFKARSPDELKQEIVTKIVYWSLHYSQELNRTDNKTSTIWRQGEPRHLCAHAGMEVAHFLLHKLDVLAFQILGASKRNEVFDWVSFRVIHDYVNAIINKDSPTELVEALTEKMIDGVNNRQMIYAQCDSFRGEAELVPQAGSQIFAFSFFVHRELEKTKRDDVEDILTGVRKLERSDICDFPDLAAMTEDVITITFIERHLEFEPLLEKLK